MTAWVNGFLGIFLTFGVAVWQRGLSETEAVVCIISSLLAGLVSLLTYSYTSRNPWIRRHLTPNPATTWIFFLITYFGTELLLAAPMRNLENFKWLVIPTIMVTGFAILIYGPIQDRIVSGTFHRRKTRGR